MSSSALKTAEEKAPSAGTAAARRELRLQLLAAAAATCRGQCGTAVAKEGALQLVQALEALNPTPSPASEIGLLEGDWRLLFASEDVTRSSPFFWAWRSMLKGVPDPSPITRLAFGTEELAESIFAVTDGIPLKSIGEATQRIYNGRLVNRVAVEIFGVGQTMMTTSCRFQPEKVGSDVVLVVETTQAVGSTLPFADDFIFPSESMLGENACVRFVVTYLDEELRIVRNEDGQVFVYARST